MQLSYYYIDCIPQSAFAPLEIKSEVDEFIGKDRVQGLELLCAIAMGYPDHTPPQPPRHTEDRITWL